MGVVMDELVGVAMRSAVPLPAAALLLLVTVENDWDWDEGRGGRREGRGKMCVHWSLALSD